MTYQLCSGRRPPGLPLWSNPASSPPQGRCAGSCSSARTGSTHGACSSYLSLIEKGQIRSNLQCLLHQLFLRMREEAQIINLQQRFNTVNVVLWARPIYISSVCADPDDSVSQLSLCCRTLTIQRKPENHISFHSSARWFSSFNLTNIWVFVSSSLLLQWWAENWWITHLRRFFRGIFLLLMCLQCFATVCGSRWDKTACRGTMCVSVCVHIHAGRTTTNGQKFLFFTMCTGPNNNWEK